MKRAQQLTFFKDLGLKTTRATEHGGGLNFGKRKERRPLARNHVIHVTMRSQKARGPLSFRTIHNFSFVSETLKIKAKKFNVSLEAFANVGNHLHLKIRIRERESFGKFMKSVSGLIARHVTGARRGKAFGKFWDTLVYSRVLKSRREEKYLDDYIVMNDVEGGFGTRTRMEYWAEVQDRQRWERERLKKLRSQRYCEGEKVCVKLGSASLRDQRHFPTKTAHSTGLFSEANFHFEETLR